MSTLPGDYSHRGAIAESSVAYCYTRAGYTVLSPQFGAQRPYDLVVERDGVFTRVQVKTGYRPNKGGDTLAFHTRSSCGVVYHGAVDVIAVFDPETSSVFAVPLQAISPDAKRASLNLGSTSRSNSGLPAAQFII